jgi:formate hydrogenlyase subunit 6/NADH:ubiquinone oxidoreductase subunit I
MEQKTLNKNKLAAFFEALAGKGKTIVAPRRRGEKFYFARLTDFGKVELDYVQTAMSAKNLVFPRCEELFKYTFKQGAPELEDVAPHEGEIVAFGIRPCDAAGFEYMSAFFLKENPDVHFQKRKENLTIISLSCKEADEYCFCTSVGLNPGSTRGADIAFTDIGDKYYVEVLTDKGAKTIEAAASLLENSQTIDKTPHLAKVAELFNADSIYKKIDSFFDSPIWLEQSLACLSCGACAYVCPTCSCFDIQDEGTNLGGARVRCWDTCAIGLFTLHASGHNPRHVQSERWRQRMKHKFEYTKETLGMLSCVGCGRCARICPAQMNIVEHILSIGEMA